MNRVWAAIVAFALAANLAAAPTLGEIRLGALSPEASRTVQLIRSGGPFPFARDGTVFANREHRLPRRRHGYYHEFTVAPAGARERGARRIVAGDEGELYYTPDHYRRFMRIRE